MILYHYTTAPGLEGIIRSKSIWASDYRFLNDATEFNYGLSIFDKLFASPHSEPISPDLVETIGNFRKGTSTFSLFIASFCRHPDLLSQWRGYNGAAGYAVGINADWLNQNAEEQGFHLVPVCYDAGEQHRLIRDKIGLLNIFLEEKAGSRTPWEGAKEWWAHILVTIAALKNEHFREEGEYRLLKVTDSWPLGTQTRSTLRGLIPYLPVKLNANIIDHPSFNRNVGIERIVVGPALQDQQQAAVDALLASQHMRVEIEKSRIPYVPQ